MKKKPILNWGWGIAIFYSTFLVIVIGSVIYTSTLDYFLVSDDYYQRGIDYQNQIDKLNRTAKLSETVTWNYNVRSQTVQFHYPNELTFGKIVFYRPSNSNLDRYVKIEKNENNLQIIKVLNWARGYWKLKIDWQTENNSYYNEGTIELK